MSSAAVGGLLGLLFGLGVWMVVAGSLPAPQVPRRPSRRRPSIDGVRVGVALGAGAVALLVTRWPTAGLGAAALAYVLGPPGRRGEKPEAMTEAIALWCEMLRDAVGTNRGLESVIAATAPSAPPLLRQPVMELAEGLGAYGSRYAGPQYSLNDALDRFCDRVAHPAADLVATSLRLSAATSQAELPRVLTALSHAAYADADSARRIDVAREQPRMSMRIVTGIIALFVVGLVVVSRNFLAPYSTATGQTVLVAIFAWWALGVWWMRRMSKPAESVRFLARRTTP